MSVVYPKLAVIGCGLIGSSVIRAARASGAVSEVVVYDASPAHRQEIAALGYAVVMGVLFWILPPLGHLHANLVEYGKHATETPLPLEDANGHLVFPGFPADLLARFRVYSLLNQVILWGGIALLFAPQAQRLLDPAAAKAAKESRLVEDHTPVAV